MKLQNCGAVNYVPFFLHHSILGYVAVLISCTARLVRLSGSLSVCRLVRATNLKTKTRREIKIGVNVPMTKASGVPIFRSKDTAALIRIGLSQYYVSSIYS